MKGLFVLRILMIASMLAVLLVAVPPAFADTPYHWVEPIDDTSTWLGTDEYNPCGFDIVVHLYGNFRGNYWLDENGQLTRAMEIFGNLKQTFTAHGKSLKTLMQGPVHYDYISENHYIMFIVGADGLLTIPGYGKVYAGAGQIVEEITLDPDTGEIISDVILKQVGNINYDDLTAFCAYLSG